MGETPVLRIGHSPDPDDAFMWWPLAAEHVGAVTSGRFRYEPVTADIETLNRRAESGQLEITALSCAQYAFVADRYALTCCGTSMGDHYGPRIVAREPLVADDLQRAGAVLAIPGERTSAFAACRLMLGPGSFRHEVVPFDEIIPRVAAGEFAAGLVIHEGQLTFADANLHLVADLGTWWASTRGLPLPLGVTAIRRDLDERFGPATTAAVVTELVASVAYALAHRQEALAVARRFAHGASDAQTARFCDMYVNRWTRDLGPVGRAAIETFLGEAHRAGLVPQIGPLDVVTAVERGGRGTP